MPVVGRAPTALVEKEPSPRAQATAQPLAPPPHTLPTRNRQAAQALVALLNAGDEAGAIEAINANPKACWVQDEVCSLGPKP
jgi:hypothetical protein